MKNSFKGNAQSLPSQLRAACASTMTWRNAWPTHWDAVLHFR